MSIQRTFFAVLLLAGLVGCSEKATPDGGGQTAGPSTVDDEKRDAGSRKDSSTDSKPDPDEDPDPVPPASKDAGAKPVADAGTRVVDAGLVADAGSVAADAAAPAADAGTAGAGAFTLTSSIYKDGQAIPATSRCESPSPPLSWGPGPSGTLSYAITLRDVTPGFSMGVTHWLIYDIPAGRFELPMAVPSGAAPASLAPIKQGPNYQSARVYQGPCGGNNTYELTLYAIDVETLPQLTATSTSAQVIAAIEAHDLASSKVTVTSSRP